MFVREIDIDCSEFNKEVNVDKPNWEDAPHWANYLAMGEDGTWYWYEEKPVADCYYTRFVCKGSGRMIRATCLRLGWMDSLESKPKTKL